jgi:hypothetical protein
LPKHLLIPEEAEMKRKQKIEGYNEKRGIGEKREKGKREGDIAMVSEEESEAKSVKNQE